MSNKYIGSELQLFENARNWKSYYGSFLKPYLGKKVAEIGAGLGGTTTALCSSQQDEWLCVEPDEALLKEIEKKISDEQLSSNICKTFCGYSAQLKDKYDSILYIDVIEHIENDSAELQVASGLLRQGGHLLIIVPAHQFLFSPFDKMIGHYRRYNKKSLKSALPESLRIKKLYYLDSVGYFASLINKLFLKQKMPSLKQIQFWDKTLVPLSKIIDRLLFFQFGKSVLLIAEKVKD